MAEPIEFQRDDAHCRREREKARKLRRTPYFQELLRRGICHYCHGHFPIEELTLDHLVPVVRGGKSTRGNLVVCCRSCNQAKRCLTPAEMILNSPEFQAELPPDAADETANNSD